MVKIIYCCLVNRDWGLLYTSMGSVKNWIKIACRTPSTEAKAKNVKWHTKMSLDQIMMKQFCVQHQPPPPPRAPIVIWMWRLLPPFIQSMKMTQHIQQTPNNKQTKKQRGKGIHITHLFLHGLWFPWHGFVPIPHTRFVLFVLCRVCAVRVCEALSTWLCRNWDKCHFISIL